MLVRQRVQSNNFNFAILVYQNIFGMDIAYDPLGPILVNAIS